MADVWLGNLIWWSVAQEGRPSRVRLHELQEWVGELRLDCPSMPRPHGAHNFRAATGNLTRHYVDDDGLDAELTIKEAAANNEWISRQVMKTTKDVRNARLVTLKVAEIRFYRPTRTSKGRRAGSEVAKPSLHPELSGTDAQQVLALIEDFRTGYAERSEYVSMAALRRVVRDFVTLKCDGVLVRPSGGLYFVEARWAQELHRLTKLIDRFGPEAGSHTIPLIDTPQQRQMVSAGLAQALIDDCRDIVTTATTEGGPTYHAHYSATVAFRRLQRLQQHYAGLLSTSTVQVPAVAAAMGEAEQALREAVVREGNPKVGRGGRTATDRQVKAGLLPRVQPV